MRGSTKPGSLMDVDATAERLGVTVRFVRRLIAERRIPYIKVGHLVRFDPAAIEEWIENARVEQLWPPAPPRSHHLRRR